MRKKVRNEGLDIHDAGMRITAKSQSSYAAREINGTDYPPLEVNVLLADIRMPCECFGDSVAFDRAREIAESLEASYQGYPDGEVSIEISFIQTGVNW